MRTNPLLPALSLVLLACTGTPPSQAPPPPEPASPDVVIITLDTTRADRLGAYGDPLARTPNLDQLARDAVLFRDATTPIPLTLPAHTSLFSGWLPARHGLRDNGGFRVGPQVPLLAAELKGAGYQTGGFVAAYVLDSTWGLDRGFDHYHDDFHPVDIAKAERFGAVERPAREVIREALSWWESPERQGSPRFLWVHLFDAHTPYEPPVDWKGDPYRGEVFEVDRALRPLLSSLPADALVIVAADHGENLWDGQELEHGTVLTRSTTRVPLLIRPPGGVPGEVTAPPRPVPERPAAWAPVAGLSPEGLVLDAVPDAPVAGRVVDTPVSLVDIAPTVRDLLGLPTIDADGRSLRGALEGGDLPDAPVYSESAAPYFHYGWAPQFVARGASRLLRRDRTDEVFDPINDPWWQSPLPEAAPGALTAALTAHTTGWQSPGGPVDATTAQALQALGYATATVTPADGELPSARDRMGSLHRLLLAQGRMKSDADGALAELESLVAQDPTLVDAWFSLATLRWSRRDSEGATTALRKVVELAPEHPLAWNNLIIVLRDTDQADQALTEALRLAQAHPEDGRWHRHVVDLLGRKERPMEVAAAAERGLAAIGPDPFLNYMLGLARLQLDDPQAALTALQASKTGGTQAPDIDLWIGQAHQKLGHIDEAVAAWQSQANLTPNDVRPTVAAAMLLVENDRCQDALPLLLTAMQRGVREQRVQEAYKACGGF